MTAVLRGPALQNQFVDERLRSAAIRNAQAIWQRTCESVK
jgi:hypothetical protein